MTTSKSPKRIALIAYTAAKQAIPLYSHRYSPKKFTQPQLIACLVLKEFFKTDYRGISSILKDSRDLVDVLELKDIPHFTTLQKASRKLLSKDTNRKLIAAILSLARKKHLIGKRSMLAALDGTGFESHHVSAYFVRRRDREVKEKYQTTTYSRFPKAGIACDTKSHLILAGVPGRGPGPDQWHYREALKEMNAQTSSKVLLADAGYDGEQNHVLARETYGMISIIPPKIGRPTVKLPKGRYRRLMALHFNKKLYGQRWQVETVNSMLKRNLGSFLRARTYWSQCKEIMLRLFTHNVTIVLFPKVSVSGDY